MASWSELPQELLRLIVDCLVTYTDQVRFACVCTSWRSMLPTISSKDVQPWLLLPRDSTNEKYEKFYTLHGGKVHYLDVPEEVLGKKFRGSSHGWLVSIEDSPRISLFNPITRVQITLPPRYKFPDVTKYCAKKLDTEYALESYGRRKTAGTYFSKASHVHEHLLDKVVLSSSPITSNSNGNFMAAAIYGSHCNLAYCKLGDKKWTPIYKGWNGYRDAIFYEDKLYALTCGWDLEVYEFSTTYPKKIEVVEPPKIEGFPRHSYLVNTSIGLLQVQRYRIVGTRCYHYQTSHFNLYKYESGCRSWCKVENIGENILFVGLNTSVSIAISDLPPGGNYKGNRIYFTDDNLDQQKAGVGGGHDIGFYDLDSKLTNYLLRNDRDEYWKWMWPAPIWYIYNPQDFINE